MNTIDHLFYILFLCLSFNFSNAQNFDPFKGEKFPVEVIPKEVIKVRQLEEKMKILKDCNWKGRQGKHIDTFWLRTAEGDFFGEVYEYFMDCDNLRLIYWYNNPSGRGEILDFMIENLEDDSDFVVAKLRHLKNKKKYKHLLNPKQ
ncbi:hypothetical protein ACJD0Z_17470 [Flavobacteriaceae bacterium M23B6Z8]